MSNETVTIPAPVRALADEIKKNISIGEGGIIEAPKDLYESHLPEGLNMKTIKTIQDYDSEIVAAASLAVGEKALEHMKKHKDVVEASMTFTAGKNKISATFQREKQVPDGKGGQQIAYGSASAKVRVYAAADRGSFSKVRQHLKASATSVFGK